MEMELHLHYEEKSFAILFKEKLKFEKNCLYYFLLLNLDEILTGLNENPENSKCQQAHEKIPKNVKSHILYLIGVTDDTSYLSLNSAKVIQTLITRNYSVCNHFPLLPYQPWYL